MSVKMLFLLICRLLGRQLLAESKLPFRKRVTVSIFEHVGEMLHGVTQILLEHLIHTEIDSISYLPLKKSALPSWRQEDFPLEYSQSHHFEIQLPGVEFQY